MKVAIIGYGKMGHEIEQVLLQRGHSVALIIDQDNAHDLCAEKLAGVDVAIEFTTPQTAEANVLRAWAAGVPVVCGTTGWKIEEFRIKNFELRTKNSDRGLMWSSNYSIGVNLLFALNKQLAKFMEAYPNYTPHMTEVHHIHKLDAPSGTAKTLQEAIGDERLALADIESGTTGNLPNHIKTNSPLYKYPHDYPNAWVKQQYLPDNIKNKKYYNPKPNKYEDNLNKLHQEMKGGK